MKTLSEHPLTLGESCFIAKKGKKYMTIRNGELALTTDRRLSIRFDSSEQAVNFLDVACIDDRNARIVGAKYDIVPLKRIAA